MIDIESFSSLSFEVVRFHTSKLQQWEDIQEHKYLQRKKKQNYISGSEKKQYWTILSNSLFLFSWKCNLEINQAYSLKACFLLTHWDNSIATSYNSIWIVIISTTVGTASHGDNPFWFRHLLIYSSEGRSHLKIISLLGTYCYLWIFSSNWNIRLKTNVSFSQHELTTESWLIRHTSPK